MDRQHDIYFIIERLRKKSINPKFLALVDQTFRTDQTLPPELLRDFRRVTYRFLRIWFTSSWTESIPVLAPAAYSARPRLKGDPDVGHVFYRKAGRRRTVRPCYHANVARGVAEYNNTLLDRQFRIAVEKEDRI